MTGGKASEFRGRGLASGAWMGGRVRGRLKGHGVVRSGVNLDGVGVNPGESESSILNAIAQRGQFRSLDNYWISGLSENNLIFFNSLLYLNNFIKCLVLSDCLLSGHVSSNCIHSDKQAQTRQNKPLHHF